MKKKLILFLSLLAFAFYANGQLIISQYIDTDSGTTPKGIELWNTSGAEIDFSVTPLKVLKGVNGGTASSDFTLNTGTLADGAVMVIGTADMSPDHEKAFSFNGDDALVIKLDGDVTDMFGLEGDDPGSAWTGNGVSTADQNIQLLSGITTGDTDGWTDPSTRFETVSTDNSLTGFGVAPETASTDEPDWCNLQWPENGTIDYGGEYKVYARVYEPGVTDAVGQGAGIDAWIGVSTEDTDPSTWTTWIPASYHGDADGFSANDNDEYIADIGSSLPAGTYYYASRFSLNSGPYVYGGFDGGEWDGSTNVSGVLTVNPAVVSLPYERDFETGDLYTDGWTTQVVTGSLDWEYSDYSGDHFAEMSNYDGGNQASETWLITPGIDLSGVNHAAFTFENACDYSGADIEVYVASDYDGYSLPSTATWSQLSPTLSTGSYTDVSSGELDISDFAGETVHIAFKYTGTDSDGKTWQIDDLNVYQYLSDDASLATFTLGGEDVTGLTDLEVADPATDDGATLYVDDFTGFEGIVIDAADAGATTEVKLNEAVVDPADYTDQALADGDVVVATVTAEDGTEVYYKVNITGENRELTLTGPALPVTFETGEDIDFAWNSANIDEINFYAVEPGTKATTHLINEDGPIDASLGSWTYTMENGVFGEYFIRIADASDQNFYDESTDKVTIDDTQDPARTAVSPADGATGQALSLTLKLTFDEDITAGTGQITVHKASDDSQAATLDPTSGTVTDNELSVDVSGLDYNTDYYVLYDAEPVEDLSGNPAAALTDKTAWTFKTMQEPTGDLFFSEYIEGSSNNKALEIYNGTGADADLTEYVVKLASNGSDWGNTLDLTGTLTNGEVFVIANANADAAISDLADETSDVTYYDGNDALGLFKGGVLIDVIGNQGEDTEWDVAGVTAAMSEHTLVRKNSVTEGNTDWTASAGTNTDDSEWIVYDQDEFSYLGSHGEAPSTEPSLTITAPEDGSTLYTQTVSVTFDVQNFQVGDNSSGTDDGYVVYSLDEGTETDLYSTDDFELTDLSLSEHTLEMWLVDNNGVSLDPAVTYSVTFTIDETVDATIYDIQYTTAEGDDGTYPSPAEGKAVNTSGIVTAVDEGTAYFIQDGAGAWNGIYVYDTNAVTEGDEVALTGEVNENYGLTQLMNISSFEVVSSGNTLPAASVVSTADANAEDYESVLVKVENAECTDADTENNYGMWTVDDGSGALLIDDDLFAFVPTAGTNYNVTGVGFYSFDNSKILPRSADDIEEAATSVKNLTADAVKLYPNPADNVLHIVSNTDISRVEVYNLLGQNVMSKTTVSKQAELNISDLDAGMYIIKVYGEKGAETRRLLKN